jgi:hypothetical protein
MDMSQYTEWHTHPLSSLFEMVAYERLDGSWDVFVYAPVASVPELEATRVDEVHSLAGYVPADALSPEEIQRIADDIEERFGENYRLVLFYEEMAERRIIQRILEHLKRRGAHGMHVGSDGHNKWQLHIRKKDLPIASEVIASNVAQT